jgi:hypothetical protein
MKLTEAYVVKLIKKSIKQFMCCCVGSTIGEGEPEGLAREGAIYIDEEAPALYYYDGTEWVVLPSAPPSLWERTGTILSPTTEDDSIELTGDKTISTPNQQTFADNAAALTALAEVGEHYTTPDGVVHTVLASVPAKLRTVIFEIDISDFNNISSPDPVPYTILLSDYEGILGTDIFKSSDQIFGFDTVCILVTPEIQILNFNIIMPTRIDNIKYIGYLHSEISLIIQGFETTDSLARLTSIDSAMGSIRATIQFLA